MKKPRGRPTTSSDEEQQPKIWTTEKMAQCKEDWRRWSTELAFHGLEHLKMKFQWKLTKLLFRDFNCVHLT